MNYLPRHRNYGSMLSNIDKTKWPHNAFEARDRLVPAALDCVAERSRSSRRWEWFWPCVPPLLLAPSGADTNISSLPASQAAGWLSAKPVRQRTYLWVLTMMLWPHWVPRSGQSRFDPSKLALQMPHGIQILTDLHLSVGVVFQPLPFQRAIVPLHDWMSKLRALRETQPIV